jgi:hypothetical protein
LFAFNPPKRAKKEKALNKNLPFAYGKEKIEKLLSDEIAHTCQNNIGSV